MTPKAWALGVLVAVAVPCLGAEFVDAALGIDPYRLEADVSAPSSAAHPLGTDALGRDQLSRLLHGGRTSLLVALFGSLLATTIGTTVGSFAGYSGGRLEAFLMRGVELATALPKMPMMVFAAAIELPPTLSTAFGAGVRLVLVMGLLSWMDMARLARTLTREIRRRGFVRASEGLGLGPWQIWRHHLGPHLAGPLGVLFALEVGENVLYESALSFLGLGISAPAASWGALMSRGLAAAREAPHMILLPGLCTLLVVAALHALVDRTALRRLASD